MKPFSHHKFILLPLLALPLLGCRQQLQEVHDDQPDVRQRGEDGEEHTRCFLNIASFGLSGESARWLKEQADLGKRGRSSYIMSSVRCTGRLKLSSESR